MTLRRNEDGKYPISVQEFKVAFPTKSFSNQPDFEAYGYSVVFPSPKPDYDAVSQRLVEGDPAQTKATGKWYQTWTVVAKEEGLDQGSIATQLAEHVSYAKTVIANYRWTAETLGITFQGVTFATDREAQANVALQWTNIQLDPTSKIDWKTDGEWVELDHDGLRDLATAVSMYVQACRSHEKKLCEAAAKAATLVDISAVLTDSVTTWPSNEF